MLLLRESPGQPRPRPRPQARLRLRLRLHHAPRPGPCRLAARAPVETAAAEVGGRRGVPDPGLAGQGVPASAPTVGLRMTSGRRQVTRPRSRAPGIGAGRAKGHPDPPGMGQTRLCCSPHPSPTLREPRAPGRGPRTSPRPAPTPRGPRAPGRKARVENICFREKYYFCKVPAVPSSARSSSAHSVGPKPAY